MIMIYYGDKKVKKRLHVLEADIIIKKNTLIWFLKGCIFLEDVFQMKAIALVSVINHQFYVCVCVWVYLWK